MEEDRETRTDEDVEAHMTKNAVAKGAVSKGRNDEGDDDDDVEAHMTKNAVTKGMTKA
jgi:hypothetical protein